MNAWTGLPDINKRRIAIFGCGLEGSSLFYRLKKAGFNIDYCIDNFRNEDFWGNPVCRLSDLGDSINHTFFYVSSRKYYGELKSQLDLLGLSEFDDYIKGGAFDRRVVMINANCYGPKIDSYLSNNAEFCSRFFVYDSTPVFDKKTDFSYRQLVKKCDVYIGQDIRDDNAVSPLLSDSFVKKEIKNDCIRIIIPNLVGMGKIIFPQSYYRNDPFNEDESLRYGMFPYGDRIIDKHYKEGKTKEEIILEIDKGATFSEAIIEEIYNSVVSKFRNRELNWDVKIIDFILENLDRTPIFYDLYHPSNLVYERMVGQILGILGVKDRSVHRMESSQNTFELFVYPEVAKKLGLSYVSSSYELRENTEYCLSRPMDYKEWIREYIAWCFERKEATSS